jgi:geranylgeranylglycerol-phosphate geranylgeranyltransferase
MNPYVELARPMNAAMASFSALLGMLVVLGPDLADPDLLIPVILGMLVPFFVTSGGNALNDYMDHHVDREAHPGRPLPSGRLTMAQVLWFAMVCFIVGIVLSAAIVTISEIELLPVLIAALAITMLIGYEVVFKYRGLVGNMAVAFLSALTFVFGASVVADPGHEGWVLVLILFALAFFASLGREITKDIEDVEADMGARSTLPMKVGVDSAGTAATLSILAAVLLSPWPYFTGAMGWPYLAVVIVADVAFIYSLSFVRSSPHNAQSIHKVGMMLALLAFLVGSLTGGIS